MSLDPRITAAFGRENGFPLEPHLVVLALMGSHSHGTYLPPEEPDAIDDVDLMGIVVPPMEYHLGLPRWQHWTLSGYMGRNPRPVTACGGASGTTMTPRGRQWRR